MRIGRQTLSWLVIVPKRSEVLLGEFSCSVLQHMLSGTAQQVTSRGTVGEASVVFALCLNLFLTHPLSLADAVNDTPHGGLPHRAGWLGSRGVPPRQLSSWHRRFRVLKRWLTCGGAGVWWSSRRFARGTCTSRFAINRCVSLRLRLRVHFLSYVCDARCALERASNQNVFGVARLPQQSHALPPLCH